jgi:Pyridoxal-dependent decarboxylase, pyridoxal binding domain
MPAAVYALPMLPADLPLALASDPTCTTSQPQFLIKSILICLSLLNNAGLLAVAKELGLDMAGVSFHVGSGASNPDALPEGIAAAAAVFARAAQHGVAMRVLDIGGGFPGGEQASWLRHG